MVGQVRGRWPPVDYMPSAAKPADVEIAQAPQGGAGDRLVISVADWPRSAPRYADNVSIGSSISA